MTCQGPAVGDLGVKEVSNFERSSIRSLTRRDLFKSQKTILTVKSEKLNARIIDSVMVSENVMMLEYIRQLKQALV
jgi:hypothetical protein